MYSSANNSAKGSTEVEPATVIPALDRWQPTHERIRSKGRSHIRVFEFARIESMPSIGSIGMMECWNIVFLLFNPSFHYTIIPGFRSSCHWGGYPYLPVM
jgi:hypothetical protein